MYSIEPLILIATVALKYGVHCVHTSSLVIFSDSQSVKIRIIRVNSNGKFSCEPL